MLKYVEKKKTIFVYTPLIIYWIALFIGTTLPAQSLPKLGMKDKLEHFLAYLGLTFLLSFTFMFQKKIKILSEKPLLFALLVGIFYGLVDELHQILIPGRSCELLDFSADMIGGFLGILFSYIIIKIDYQEGRARIDN